jgi:putative tricarboxylic transport membrane protein
MMNKSANLMASVIVIFFAGFFYYQANQLPSTNINEFGPALMPKIYSVILLILGIFLLFQSLRLKRERVKTGKSVLITMGVLILTVFLIPILGFYLVAWLFLILFFWITKQRTRKILIAIPLSTIIIIYLFFERLLSVPIPKGMFF